MAQASRHKPSRGLLSLLASRFSPRTIKIALAVAGGLVLATGSAWAYYRFTTVPPPDLAVAKVETVTEFLGNPRAFPRLDVAERETFLLNTFQRFSRPEEREELTRSFRRMADGQKQVFVDATFDVLRTRVVERADQFNRLPTKEKTKFVDETIRHFKAIQGDLGARGSGNPEMNLGEPFKPLMPAGTDDWSKILVTRTTAKDRAKAQPFLNAMAKRYQEMKRLQKKP